MLSSEPIEKHVAKVDKREKERVARKRRNRKKTKEDTLLRKSSKDDNAPEKVEVMER